MSKEIPFTELFTMDVTLTIVSEVGDKIQASAPTVRDNAGTNSEILARFDEQVETLRKQVAAYIKRRFDRKEKWQG